MSLLQIVEPGEAQPSESSQKVAVGIDLGTTNTLVASVRNSAPVVLEDAKGRANIPSLVYYRDGQAPLVGHDTEQAMLDDTGHVIASVKRLLGRGQDDVRELAEAFAYHFADGDARIPQIATADGAKTAIEVSADILKACKQRTLQVLEVGEIDGAVITVPAYFDDAQRQATRDAARIAGIHIYRLINEPTAAAVAYGLDQAHEGETIAVLDLGGGTFDVSILRLEKGVLQTIATGGDSLFGGDDFDRVIADDFCYSLPAVDGNLQWRRRILNFARDAKEAVCRQGKTFSGDLEHDGESYTLELSPDKLDSLLQPLLNKIDDVCAQVLSDAALSPADITSVVLVGGSTRVPLVKKRIAEIFKCQPFDKLDPDQVVALGAAIQADVLSGNANIQHDMLLLDVVPLSLGIETMGGLVEKLIPRNSTIPITKAQEFTTAKDGQTGISMHVVQGERDLVSDCRSLARFELSNIPPRTAGAARVRVSFQVDADGMLLVEARETENDHAVTVEVKPTYGLSDKEVAQMIEDSVKYAQDDVEARTYKEKQVDARRVLDALEAALAQDAEALLNEDELARINTARQALEQAMDSKDAGALEVAIKQLESTSEFYVERRMNQSIQSALKGARLEDAE